MSNGAGDNLTYTRKNGKFVILHDKVYVLDVIEFDI